MSYFGIPLRNGVPIGLGSIAGFGVAPAFSPADLFSAGEQGAWYDPSDLTTLFQDSAGTTPVTAVEQFVGLMLDKSKGLVLGPELVTNGDFSSGTGWSLPAGADISGDKLNLNSPVSNVTSSYLPTIGKTYQWTIEISNYVSGTVNFSFGGATRLSATANGVYSGIAVGVAATTSVRVLSAGTPVASVDNISVRELPGNHATSTGTKRPKLAARYNLLVGTDTLATQSVTTAATTYTLRFGGTGSIALSGTATGTYSAGTHSITATAGTLTLTVTGSVTTADLRPASQATGLIGPTYQRVVDAATYDTAGYLPYLSFDGVDDSMSTGSIDFTATDKMTVWAGVRKTGVPDGTGFIYELSVAADTNNGAFRYGVESGGIEYFPGSRGTAFQQITINNASYAPPVTNVLQVSSDISAPSIIARINGSQVGSNTSSQGTGNYGNYPLFIGSRNNASVYFQGWLTSLIVRGAQSTQSQIEATESWVNGKTGAY